MPPHEQSALAISSGLYLHEFVSSRVFTSELISGYRLDKKRNNALQLERHMRRNRPLTNGLLTVQCIHWMNTASSLWGYCVRL